MCDMTGFIRGVVRIGLVDGGANNGDCKELYFSNCRNIVVSAEVKPVEMNVSGSSTLVSLRVSRFLAVPACRYLINVQIYWRGSRRNESSNSCFRNFKTTFIMSRPSSVRSISSLPASLFNIRFQLSS